MDTVQASLGHGRRQAMSFLFQILAYTLRRKEQYMMRGPSLTRTGLDLRYHQ
jgi:hypothetical protein